MAISALQLRQDVYRLLDEVLRTGVPLEVEWKGQLLRIAPADARTRLERLPVVDDLVTGDPTDLASIDWSARWPD